MRLDWDAGHGPVTGPLNAGLTALAVGYGGHALDMPWQWAALTAGAGMAGSCIAGWRARASRATLSLRAAGWLAAGGWCAWAVEHGPWTQWGIGTLTAGVVGLGLATAGADRAQRAATARQAQEQRQTRRNRLAAEWEDRILRVCRVSVRIVGVEQWPSGGGYSLDGELAEGGARWRDIAGHADRLAADARLPEGCGVEAGPGAHRGAVLLHVSTVNQLAEDAPYPEEYGPLSVTAPAPIGVRRDGTPEGPVARQASMLIVGQRGSGKTNLMHVMIANQCRMTDSLTWVIDLNGGGLALKWLRAWDAAGRPGRPPVDWVADTPQRAAAMAAALVRIAKARKVGYQDREIAANDDKIPVDRDVPEIRVILDEGAEIFSARSRRDETLRRTADDLVQTLEIARAAAVNLTVSGLRATQDVLSDPQVLRQTTYKAGLKVDTDTELHYLFGWRHGATVDDAPYPGCALVRDGDAPVHPLKIYRIRPEQITGIVTATAHLRPELDDLSRRAAGEVYEQRWTHTEHLVTGLPASTGPQPETTAQPASPRRSVTADWDTPTATGTAQDAIDQAEAARRRLHDAIDDASTRDADLDQQFLDILAAGGVTWQPPTSSADDQDRADPRRGLVIEIVTKAGPDGIGPEPIRDAIRRLHPDIDPPHPATISRWLQADPRIHRPRYGRYAIRPDQQGDHHDDPPRRP